MGSLVSGCVIDTNILIYHLAGVLTDQAEVTLADALGSGFYISIITRIELLGWRKHSSDSLKAARRSNACQRLFDLPTAYYPWTSPAAYPIRIGHFRKGFSGNQDQCDENQLPGTSKRYGTPLPEDETGKRDLGPGGTQGGRGKNKGARGRARTRLKSQPLL